MKKQASLLNFFKKTPVEGAVQPSQQSNSSKKPVLTQSFLGTPQKDGKTLSDSKASSVEPQLKKMKISPSGGKDTPSLRSTQTSVSTPKSSIGKDTLDVLSMLQQAKPKQVTSTAQKSATPVFHSSSKKTSKTPQKKETRPSKSTSDDADVLIDIEKNEGKVFDYNDFTDVTPSWAMKENARDANGRRPTDPNYDPTTLYIPLDEVRKYTPTMQQYWRIKSQNYDKLLLFKLGKFYELFYEDALICHKELDLNWMANKMHVGFPEKALDRFANELVNRGFKVCIVEQTETPKEMEERLRGKSRYHSEDKTIKREMVQVMSKGTYIDPEEPDHEPRILLSFRIRKNLISVAFLEIGYNQISLGSFQDDDNHTLFKTFISQVRPTEVIYETIETDPEFIRMLKNSSSQPVLSPLNDPTAWNTVKGYADLEKYYGAKEEWPEEVKEVMEKDEFQRDQIMVCFSGMTTYLDKMLIADNVLFTARYSVYDTTKYIQNRMVLDSQALQHLEILEVEYSTRNTVEGSLLSFVDRTSSKFGKRLMKKWICAPLLSVKAINDRLDAIEELESVYDVRSRFVKKLKELPDLERSCGRIFKLSVKRKQNVVMFEDVSVAKLKEFRRLLDNLRKAREILDIFRGASFNSQILQRLTTFDDFNLVMQGKTANMPEILPLLDEISNFICWKGPQKDTPGPRPGIDSDYDAAQKEIDNIEKQLNDYLETVRAQLGNDRSICYVHSKKRYEIEVPDKLVAGNKKPREFEFSSKKQNRERFITKKTVELVEKLEQREEEMKHILSVFVTFIFGYFYNHHKVWDRFLEGIAQLDCLCSLSLASFVSDGKMCRPVLFPPNEQVFMEIKDMRHPCISMYKANFIPNDILIGNLTGEDMETVKDHNIMLLTGPNMGGKSTVLRQACIAAVLAQLGCYIPATSCKLSVVDRIFTRIGASDRLLEGKSTFYIEMEETLNVLKYGTKNSLAIMDELGRGTSTYDGLAIAYSVLKHISNNIKCRTLFATHYHVLLDEYRDDPNVEFYHMAAKMEQERILFLYKLIEGECSNSFGLNIAKVAGLPETVLKTARGKANEFEKEFSLRENVQTSKAIEKALLAISETIIQQKSADDCLNDIRDALLLIQK